MSYTEIAIVNARGCKMDKLAQNMVEVEVLSRLDKDEDPKRIASVLCIQYATVLRIRRESEERIAEMGKTPICHIPNNQVVTITGVRPQVMTEILDSSSPVTKHLNNAASAVLSQISKLAVYTPDITASELDSLASGVAKLRLAFVDDVVTMPTMSNGLSNFADVLKD